MRTFVAGVLLGMVGGSGAPALANDASRAKADEALRVCEQVDRMPAGTDKFAKLDQLERGVELGEEAVHADDTDAKAHFALFCNVGMQVDVSGLSWRVLGRLRRMRAELDRTLALAPDYAEALIAKGEMLRRLPASLGGDKTVAVQLFHRGLAIKPDYVVGQLYLARAMRDDGSPDARAQANAALTLARKMGAVREETEARQLVASLDQ